MSSPASEFIEAADVPKAITKTKTTTYVVVIVFVHADEMHEGGDLNKDSTV
jgi:hypothetical protein